MAICKDCAYYVNEGLSVLTNIHVPLTPFTRNLRNQYAKSLTQALPKLDHADSAGQGNLEEAPQNHQKNERTGGAIRVGLQCLGFGRTWGTKLHFGQGVRAWPVALGV